MTAIGGGAGGRASRGDRREPLPRKRSRGGSWTGRSPASGRKGAIRAPSPSSRCPAPSRFRSRRALARETPRRDRLSGSGAWGDSHFDYVCAETSRGIARSPWRERWAWGSVCPDDGDARSGGRAGRRPRGQQGVGRRPWPRSRWRLSSENSDEPAAAGPSAMQILFQADLDREADPSEIRNDSGRTIRPMRRRAFADDLVEGATARREEIDELLRRISEHWSVSRMVRSTGT